MISGRRTLLRTGFVSGAGLLVPGVARAAGPQPQGEPATPGDRTILTYLFDAEYIQVALYEHALTLELDRRVATFARHALRRHRGHVRMLKRVNRDADVVVNRPTIFQFQERDQQGFLLNARRIENAASAGAGTAVALVEDQHRLEPMMVIATDEAAHAGAVAELLGLEPSPTAFDDPLPLEACRRVLTTA